MAPVALLRTEGIEIAVVVICAVIVIRDIAVPGPPLLSPYTKRSSHGGQSYLPLIKTQSFQRSSSSCASSRSPTCRVIARFGQLPPAVGAKTSGPMVTGGVERGTVGVAARMLPSLLV